MSIRTLKIVYIRSSKYDDDGYVLRYWRGVLPSNTLLCLKTLTQEAVDRGVLEGVDVTIECYDDTVERIPVRRLARENRRAGTCVLVGLVGVQSNQFPRASDLALEFREAGVDVMIGGFHVSGILALFDRPSIELQRLLDHGVTLVKGEVEGPGVLDGILRDACNGGLKTLYDAREYPSLLNAPVPRPQPEDLRRFFAGNMATIDTSRGCPYDCSFCTVVNVQGHKMRYRSAACVIESVKISCDEGIDCFFFTDDNLSRNPVWEELFDGLIALRREGHNVKFMMQVDTQAYRIPRFVNKAARAGCYRVFVGMESLNPANLEAAGKRQNHADQYAAMVEAWRDEDVLVYVGYIIGFPYDTPDSVRRDIEMLCSEVKVDEASYFMLTPLPGSRDHKRMVEERVPLDADLNRYDSVHETFRHPGFEPGEWHQSYVDACQTFYGKENIVNILLRTSPKRYWQMFWTLIYYRYCALTETHPMLTGLFPLKGWKRRPGYPGESRLRLLGRRMHDFARGARIYRQLFIEFQEIWLLTRQPEDPRWATLAELRDRWASVHARLSEYDVRGRCDAAKEELRAMLQTASARLHSLSRLPVVRSRRIGRNLASKAREVDEYLRSFELQAPTWRRILDAEHFIRDRLLGGYEEVAIRYVAQRRKVNALRTDLAQRIKQGRILTLNLDNLIGVVGFEVVFGLRFALIALLRAGA
ncbi:MAG TPA: radical SAM protein [Candidatus Hydrogenedentes bacterium]|mgnify:CR=1 FL=1|nr:radical SAM protein [Candidatus Hydrogenedentota bacterium]